MNSTPRNILDILHAPMVTEKTHIQSSNNKYFFTVAPSATKGLIKKSVESAFSVNVTKINVSNRKGKTKRFKGTLGKRKNTKIAVITLKSGQQINYES